MRAGSDASHRRDINDHASSLLAHGGDCVLCAQQYTAHVDVECAHPSLGRELGEDNPLRVARLDDSRVVHHDVQPAEALARAEDHPAHVAVVGHVGRDWRGAAPAPFDQPYGFARALFIDVVDGDGSTVTRQPLRRGPTDARTRAGDQCDRSLDLHQGAASSFLKPYSRLRSASSTVRAPNLVNPRRS